MSQEEDVLQYLPPEKWSKLKSVFKKDCQRGRTGYAVLQTQQLWLENGDSYGFKVYCPFGNVDNGMVALNVKNESYEVIILCPNDDTEKLEEALIKTKLIDWKRPVLIPFAPKNAIDCVQRVLKHVDAELGEILPSATFVLDGKTDPYDVELPEGITFGHLTLDHVNIVNDTWPHKYPTSDWYFQLIIKAGHGYGLFFNGALICWCLISESGTLLHMYTVEEHRRKGYADIVLKLVSNVLLKEKRDVLAFCVATNKNAIKLYERAGFDKLDGVAWYIPKIIEQ
ncbi:unnamed protein product [Chrysodeixis includens]|uniref:N-acetyltransferase domain-containing protein n=1 Tax=Chrysodeixis includens TaxID=689277 RepID=A0A9P0BTQ0_CHRIL|nr:unnamed protein product [Chrysodeixis includens]